MALYLLCGMAFAGKSTLARALAAHLSAEIVSLDEINARRGLVGGRGLPDHEWAASHEQALEEVRALLASARDVVVDDTTCFRFLRDDFRKVAREQETETVLIFVDASEELLRQRRRENEQSHRRDTVTDPIFRDLLEKFEHPTPDEHPLVFPAVADPGRWVAAHIRGGARRAVAAPPEVETREGEASSVEDLPFIDEHSRRVDAPADVVCTALVTVLRRKMGGAAWFARLLGCDPAVGSAEFAGQPGEAVPGFRVAEAEPRRRLALRGRHRFAEYALTFVLDGDRLRAETRAAFPGVLGWLYRAAVIGSGGHRLITRRLLRQVAGSV